MPSFCREVHKNCAILGYCAATSNNFLPTFRNNHSFLSSVVNNPRAMDSLPLKTGTIGCSETSVRNYHYSPRYNPEGAQFSFVMFIKSRFPIYIYISRFQNVLPRCPTPRLHCFLSSHWPSCRFLSFMAFLIPSIQFFLPALNISDNVVIILFLEKETSRARIYTLETLFDIMRSKVDGLENISSPTIIISLLEFIHTVFTSQPAYRWFISSDGKLIDLLNRICHKTRFLAD